MYLKCFMIYPFQNLDNLQLCQSHKHLVVKMQLQPRVTLFLYVSSKNV